MTLYYQSLLIYRCITFVDQTLSLNTANDKLNYWLFVLAASQMYYRLNIIIFLAIFPHFWPLQSNPPFAETSQTLWTARQAQ